jgi:hemerythrin superfamily protein
MGLIERLEQEHEELVYMIDEISQLQDGERKSHDYHGSFQRLLSHEGSEEETLYEALDDRPEVDGAREKGRDDHRAILRAVELLNEITPDNILWDERLGDLASLVKEHVGREEEELFPPAREILGAERLERLEEQYAEVAKVLDRPPSRTVNRV